MSIPPNMKRRAPERPGFRFTELSLSEADLARLCVIPSRAPAALSPVPVPVRARNATAPAAAPLPRRRRPLRRPARWGTAAGLASLALASCTPFTQPTLVEATVEVVQLARAAFLVQKWVLVSAAPPAAAPQAPQGRASRGSARPGPAPATVDSGLLAQADRALSAGEYRAALATYRKLLRRQPSRVEALFGAALASHELDLVRDSAAYLERTLALRPDHPLGNVLAGFGAQLGGRYGEARRRYSRFLSVEASGDQADEIRAVLANLPAEGPGPVAAAR